MVVDTYEIGKCNFKKVGCYFTIKMQAYKYCKSKEKSTIQGSSLTNKLLLVVIKNNPVTGSYWYLLL
jgi:hypothetical protein